MGPIYSSAWTRAKWRARSERARAHAETRPERWWNIAEKFAAAGAVAVVGSGSGDIGAHPLTTSFAKRIDALHGETRQILHIVFSSAAGPLPCRGPEQAPESPVNGAMLTRSNVGADCGAIALWCQAKRLLDIGVLLPILLEGFN
jgi:hypothetical protein